ncbi:MAG TPA: hypothetical protein VJ717_20460 [Gemmatimonadaceae bacterium]|nr:hypothetical protein [Gemmatimonadaceae bacterium]
MIRASLIFILLTVAMTWPQAAQLSTHAWDHFDVYFNLWRLRWIAHALASSPTHLFDGNIFYPESGALTLSDALLVEGLLGAPLFWVGLPPVLVHNLLLLAGIVGSALGMFMLARHLTGSYGAGLLAGAIFAFVPYRFDHYMHMELQWAMWIPWTFWALDRALETGAPRYGALTGLFVGLQMLSSIYYGIFLSLLLVLVATLLLVTKRGRDLRRASASVAIGAAIAAFICALYAIPYLSTHEKVGNRSELDIATFSARPSSYLFGTPENWLYRDKFEGRGMPERRLFPGITAAVLALAGLLLRSPNATSLVYLLAMIAAFELSLGIRGYSYMFLHAHVPILGGLRAPARFGIFVVFFLGALAAFGYAAIESSVRPQARRIIGAIAVTVALVEYWVAPLPLIEYPNKPPLLYQWLAQQPPGVVVELPMPIPNQLTGADAEIAYMSTFHWKPVVNGYSGYFPRSYLQRLDRMRDFPEDPRGFRQFAHDGVRYVIVHPDLYQKDRGTRVLEALAVRPELIQLGVFDSGRGKAFVFRRR